MDHSLPHRELGAQMTALFSAYGWVFRGPSSLPFASEGAVHRPPVLRHAPSARPRPPGGGAFGRRRTCQSSLGDSKSRARLQLSLVVPHSRASAAQSLGARSDFPKSLGPSSRRRCFGHSYSLLPLVSGLHSLSSAVSASPSTIALWPRSSPLVRRSWLWTLPLHQRTPYDAAP